MKGPTLINVPLNSFGKGAKSVHSPLDTVLLEYQEGVHKNPGRIYNVSHFHVIFPQENLPATKIELTIAV